MEKHKQMLNFAFFSLLFIPILTSAYLEVGNVGSRQ